MTLSVFRKSLEAPENNSFIHARREKLRGLIAAKGYQYSPTKDFKLASGKKCNHYVDCRTALGHADALKCASTCLQFAVSQEIEAIGGVATGGISLASSISHNMSLSPFPKPWFYVRAQAKSHGTKRLIEGYAPENAKVVLIDDVITSAQSVLKAAEICKQHGLQVTEIITLVARSQIGVQAIEDVFGAEFPIKALFDLEEIHQEWLNHNKT